MWQAMMQSTKPLTQHVNSMLEKEGRESPQEQHNKDQYEGANINFNEITPETLDSNVPLAPLFNILRTEATEKSSTTLKH